MSNFIFIIFLQLLDPKARYTAYNPSKSINNNRPKKSLKVSGPNPAGTPHSGTAKEYSFSIVDDGQGSRGNEVTTKSDIFYLAIS